MKNSKLIDYLMTLPVKMLNLMAVTPVRGNQADSGGYFLRTA